VYISRQIRYGEGTAAKPNRYRMRPHTHAYIIESISVAATSPHQRVSRPGPRIDPRQLKATYISPFRNLRESNADEINGRHSPNTAPYMGSKSNADEICDGDRLDPPCRMKRLMQW